MHVTAIECPTRVLLQVAVQISHSYSIASLHTGKKSNETVTKDSRYTYNVYKELKRHK